MPVVVTIAASSDQLTAAAAACYGGNMNIKRTLSTAGGVLRARGPFDPAVQRVLRVLVEQGHRGDAIGVLVEYLVATGIAENQLPAPRGLCTPALRARVKEVAADIAAQYGTQGVLVAKGYLTPSELAERIAEKWEASFGSVIDPDADETFIFPETTPNFNARISVSAQSIAALLQRFAVDSEGEHILVPMKELEPFCVAATKKAYEAFTATDLAVHKLLHGDPDE